MLCRRRQELICCQHLMQVSASDTLDGKAMPDSKADEYLKEWVNAKEIRERCIIPERDSFRYA